MTRADIINETLYRQCLSLGLNSGDSGEIADRLTRKAIILVEKENLEASKVLGRLLKELILVDRTLLATI